MNSREAPCPVCLSGGAAISEVAGVEARIITCALCRIFRVDASANDALAFFYSRDRKAISNYIRTHQESGRVTLSFESLAKMVEEGRPRRAR